MATTTTVLASSTESLVQFTTNASYPITNAYTNSSSTSYAQLTLSKKNSTSTMYFSGFDFSAIPSNATIQSVTVKFKGMVNSTSYVSAATVQAYAGATAKGSSTSFRTTSATAYTLSAGTWTRSELDNLKLYISAKAANNNNTKYIRVYGMDVAVTWDAPAETDSAYIKQGGVWREAVPYIKRSGAWVQVSPRDIDQSANYVVS